MSTFLSVTAATAALLGLPSLIGISAPQGAVGPGKILGPDWLSLSGRSVKASQDFKVNAQTLKFGSKSIYWYEVELNQSTNVPTVINLSDTANKLSKPATVTVPANSLSESFWVVPISTGHTTLVASNPNRTATLGIDIEF